MARPSSTKLTLVVDPNVIKRAKSYAADHNTSISSLVEAYLSNLTSAERQSISEDPNSWPPTTRSLFGALRSQASSSADADELRAGYLTQKYLHD